MPFVIVGDEAFLLKRHRMKPYAQKGLSDGKRIYNHRHSRARRTSENAFGILAQSFRGFFTTIQLDPAIVELVILACCTLHNLLRTLSRDYYSPELSVDSVNGQGDVRDGEWRNKSQSQYLYQLNVHQGKKASYDADDVRNYFKEYFQTEGAVPWQYQHIYAN